MTIKQWIDNAIQSRLICTDYVRKLSYADTKEGLFRVICDPNGGNWIFDLELKLKAKGLKLPKEEFKQEFKNYINGQRVMEYGDETIYTSKFYMERTEDVIADTTIVYLLDCNCKVIVPPNRYPNLVISDRSEVVVEMGENAHVTIDTYGDAKYVFAHDEYKPITTHHDGND